MDHDFIIRLPMAPETLPLRYAGFWRRFQANLVDCAVMLPVAMGGRALLARSKTWSAFGVVLVEILGLLYPIVLHATYGQTVGKMVARIRLVTPSGGPITASQAFRRSSVDLVFALLSVLGTQLAIRSVPSSAWGHGWLSLDRAFDDARPAWYRWVEAAWTLWFFSEVVTLFFDRKRRALHDFIAGTVVVRLVR